MTWKPNSPIPQPRPLPPQLRSSSDPWHRMYVRLFLILTLLLPLMFVGCSAYDPVAPVVSLPPPPAFGPSSVPPPRAGEPLVLICAREQAGRLENERVIQSWENWYEGLLK